MRCPKCGFISFDYLDVCLKCKKNIKAATEDLRGTVYNVAAPTFLRLQEDDDEVAELDVVEETVELEDEDYIDEDLEILMGDDAQAATAADEEEEEAGIAFSLDEDQEDEPEPAPAAAQEDEDGEIDFDFAGLDEDGEEEGEAVIELDTGKDEEFSLDMPDELADVSDLAPPTASEAPAPAAPVSVPPPAPATSKSLDDLDLDSLQLDLGLDDEGGWSSGSEEKELALDDIDFSDTLGTPVVENKGKKPTSSLDDDLDFDLDLGGLSIHNEPKSNK